MDVEVQAAMVPALDHRPEVSRAYKLRQKIALDRLDYARYVYVLSQEGVTQAELSEGLHISQPSVSDTVRKAAQLPPVPEGFSGASPYEIAQRYFTDEDFSRDRLIRELSEWDYPEEAPTDGFESVLPTVQDSFDQVTRALDEGLIDAEAYDEILDRIGRRQGR